MESVNIKTDQVTILIGDNNSGKTNLLKALTLPFINDEVGAVNKNLGWHDINTNAKNEYYQFIDVNLDNIKDNSCNIDDFREVIPTVTVEINFEPKDSDEYYVRKWLSNIDGESRKFSIRYEFDVENHGELYDHVSKVVKEEATLEQIKMNLLPINFYKYRIVAPATGDPVSFNDLNEFQYNALTAERDEFSSKETRIGSNALISILQNKLTESQTVQVEKSYEQFFRELKEISSVEDLFNWQEDSDLYNAKDFFSNITLLPNMPSMSSLLNNVKLGYGDDYLNAQGLGYRNLIYLFVMMHSLKVSKENVLNLLTLEEPEAHLSISNSYLLGSFINSIQETNNHTQLFISTHSSQFINKLKLENVAVLNNGKAFSLSLILEENELGYLSKKPNLDFLKFLFSRNCILVEGPTEEMIIKAYLSNQNDLLNDIEVISLHKGFVNMIKIWLKVNENSNHRLGIIRDFDNQPAAQARHEEYNQYENIYVTTTQEYTLEPEIVKTENNFEILKKYFIESHQWEDVDTPEQLSNKWRNAKTDTMLKFCRDLEGDKLVGFELPNHINKVLKFLRNEIEK